VLTPTTGFAALEAPPTVVVGGFEALFGQIPNPNGIALLVFFVNPVMNLAIQMVEQGMPYMGRRRCRIVDKRARLFPIAQLLHITLEVVGSLPVGWT